MKVSAWRMRGFALCSLALSASIPLAAQDLARKEIIRQARDSYYSLQREGMAEFRSQVKVDWDMMFKAQMNDAVMRDQVLPILRQVRFQVVVGPSGSSTVSHQSDLAPPKEVVAERLRNAIGGVEKVITGFFQTWQGFVISPPFPAIDGEYQLDSLGEMYRLSYRQAPADVVISMAHDFAIADMKVTMPEIEGTIHPQFSREKVQFVLVGYDTNFKAPSGNSQQLTVKIENQFVDGLYLPGTVDIAVVLPSGPQEIRLTFTGFQVKKR